MSGAVTLRRTMDAAFLNGVLNDPSVAPWVRGGATGALDVSAVVADPGNVALVTEHGGFLVVRHEPGVYEAHTHFLPAGRGEHVAQAVAAAFEWMFLRTDCWEVVTRVPAGNAAAAALAERAGFRELFRRPAAWPAAEGMEDCAYLGITLAEWVQRSDACLAEGYRFHSALEIAKLGVDSAAPGHAADEAHDRAAGAASLMVRQANAAKAVVFYNRWARLAGYETIELLSVQPPLIDIRDAVVSLEGQQMEVVLCR